MSNKIDFGTFGSASYTEMEIEEQDVYAKYVSTAPSTLCIDGSYAGMGGASPYNDDTSCATATITAPAM